MGLSPALRVNLGLSPGNDRNDDASAGASDVDAGDGPASTGAASNLHLGVGLSRRWHPVFHMEDVPTVFRPPSAAARERELRHVQTVGRVSVLPVPLGAWSLRFARAEDGPRFMARWRDAVERGELQAFLPGEFDARADVDAELLAGPFAHRKATNVLGISTANMLGRCVIAAGWPILRDYHVLQGVFKPFVQNHVARFVHIVPTELAPTPPDTLVAIVAVMNNAEAHRAARTMDGTLFRNRRLAVRVLD
jgi:hypothetical protein